MELVEKTRNHWGSKFPTFLCRTLENYDKMCIWMRQNKVEYFLWSSGSGGYTFDIRTNIEWFILKWQ